MTVFRTASQSISVSEIIKQCKFIHTISSMLYPTWCALLAQKWFRCWTKKRFHFLLFVQKWFRFWPKSGSKKRNQNWFHFWNHFFPQVRKNEKNLKSGSTFWNQFWFHFWNQRPWHLSFRFWFFCLLLGVVFLFAGLVPDVLPSECSSSQASYAIEAALPTIMSHWLQWLHDSLKHNCCIAATK